MAIVVGIDEAGFGPILGPLTVSAVAFSATDPQADLWDALAPAVTAKPAKRQVGVAVGDSKRIYSPSTGLIHLERGVLAFLQTLPAPLESLRAALSWLCPAAVEAMDECPWYRDIDRRLPTTADPADLKLRRNGLAAAMDGASVRLLGASCRVLTAGRYNRLVAATDNKATTLGDQTFSLIDWAWRNRPPGESVHVVVDRQGGRMRYLPILQRLFPGAEAYRILVEQPDHSGYRLRFGGDDLEAHFLSSGERRHLPIALASMTSKYIRELFMGMLNRFWAEAVGDAALKPTAGYYTDGLRFLDDIADARRRLGVPDELLIRSR